jgi:hypothetical protein
MKSLSFKLGILLLLVLTFGCSSINKQMQSAMGQPISGVIDSWGPPSRVTPDGRGGSVYVWEQWMPIGDGYIRSRIFWADSNGIIYQWRWRGL